MFIPKYQTVKYGMRQERNMYLEEAYLEVKDTFFL